MTQQELQTVVLQRDIPARGLRRGDLGTIVFVYESGAVEAEFVRMSGNTQAVLTLEPGDFRPGSDEDVLAVRSIG
jgi:hypothetical protein